MQVTVRSIVTACVLLLAAGAQAQALDGLDAELARASGELETASAQRDRVSAEVGGLVAERDGAQRRLRTRVHALYRMRRAGMLPLAGGIDALLRHQSRTERLERMVERDLAALRSLSRRITVLHEETARLASDAERAEHAVSALRERRDALERATIGLWAGATVSPEAEAPWSDGFGLRLADGAPMGPRFEGMRGRLPMPVGGSARLSDAQREGGAGIELAASPGVSVRAVAGGRVAYAALHPAYGPLVIVEHDGGYYTVYGGLASLAVHAGDPVSGEAALGITGADPVFFQVRRGTRPLFAREWLGL